MTRRQAKGPRSRMEQMLFDAIKSFYQHTGYFGITLAMALESFCIPLPSEIFMPLSGYFVYKSADQFSLPGVPLSRSIGCLLGSAVAYPIHAAVPRPLLL